jgi:putative acetyltransferase
MTTVPSGARSLGTNNCAAARGAKRISVDASDSAQEFFAGRGYMGQQRNSISIGDEWLANTTMTKILGDTPSDDNPRLQS